MSAAIAVAAAAGLMVVAAAGPTPTIHHFAELAIDREGDQLASVESHGVDGHGVVVVRNAADGTVARTIDPCGTCKYSALAFGKDHDLAFLSHEPKSDTTKLLVDDGVAGRAWVMRGLAKTVSFSPDGKRIALLVSLGATKDLGAIAAGARSTGEIGETSDDLRLAVVDRDAPTDAAITPISPVGRYVYDYDWTPDGATVAAVTAPGDGDSQWWVATLDAIDTRSGAVRRIATPTTQIAFPRVTADGRSVAFIGGLMSDAISNGGDIWTVALTGGAPRNRTPGAKISYLSLTSTGAGLRSTGLAGAEMSVRAFGVDPPEDRVLYQREATLAAGVGRVAFDADGGVAATVIEDFTHGPAIYAGSPESLKKITTDNDALPPSVEARSISWRNDGFDVQGWLLSPLGANPATRHPMVVSAHGGPAAAYTPIFEPPYWKTLLDAGYWLFLPNFRGSFGQGEAFAAANRRDFGGGDLRDILTGVDAVVRQAPVDPARVGLTGCSYGGEMAMIANVRTSRFKAIVAGAGVSDFISYYGTNGIDQWMIPYFGASMYDDPAVYRQASAIETIKAARTPTFVYVGERDIEVPPTQSFEYWHALKALGVPTSLVVYPDAGHCVADPVQAADVRARAVRWFDRYLKP